MQSPETMAEDALEWKVDPRCTPSTKVTKGQTESDSSCCMEAINAEVERAIR